MEARRFSLVAQTPGAIKGTINTDGTINMIGVDYEGMYKIGDRRVSTASTFRSTANTTTCNNSARNQEMRSRSTTAPSRNRIKI